MKLVLVAAALAAFPVLAEAAQATQDWPCVQVRQPRLSIGQMWTGPLPDDAASALAAEAGTQRLAGLLAQRRVSLEEAAPLIAAVPAEPAPRTALFVALFDKLERERERLLEGISRYGHGQAALAAQIEGRRARMAELQKAASPDFDAIDAEEAKLDWDTRIFTERQQMLTAVCESPVLIERRLFEMARLIATGLATPTPAP